MNGHIDPKIIAAAKHNFVMLCLDALQRGYDSMVKDAQYDRDWKEDKLTAQLVDKTKSTGFLREKQISVNHQPPIYSQGVIYGEEDPLNAPKVDFKFTKWYSKLELDYYAEAKNVSETDWLKKDGSVVNASKYRARYIDTGIENFLTDRYPEGCLLAYVVHGKTENIITGINRLIESRKINPRVGLIKKDSSVPFSVCHASDHVLKSGERTIRHLFLQF